MFSPDEDPMCPIPPRYLDIMRTTKTDSEFKEEALICDLWPDDGAIELTGKWTGTTSFEILRPRPKKNYMREDGRLTKRQTTTRLGNIWTEA